MHAARVQFCAGKPPALRRFCRAVPCSVGMHAARVQFCAGKPPALRRFCRVVPCSVGMHAARVQFVQAGRPHSGPANKLAKTNRFFKMPPC